MKCVMKAVYLYFQDSGNEKGIIAYPIRRVRVRTAA
jgi:hypothetical protein